jgi:hypothetical protein
MPDSDVYGRRNWMKRESDSISDAFALAQAVAFVSLVPLCSPVVYYWRGETASDYVWVSAALYVLHGPMSFLLLLLRWLRRPWVQSVLIAFTAVQCVGTVASLGLVLYDAPYRPSADHGAVNVVVYAFALAIGAVDMARLATGLRLLGRMLSPAGNARFGRDGL